MIIQKVNWEKFKRSTWQTWIGGQPFKQTSEAWLPLSNVWFLPLFCVCEEECRAKCKVSCETNYWSGCASKFLWKTTSYCKPHTACGGKWETKESILTRFHTLCICIRFQLVLGPSHSRNYNTWVFIMSSCYIKLAWCKWYYVKILVKNMGLGKKIYVYWRFLKTTYNLTLHIKLHFIFQHCYMILIIPNSTILRRALWKWIEQNLQYFICLLQRNLIYCLS